MSSFLRKRKTPGRKQEKAASLAGQGKESNKQGVSQALSAYRVIRAVQPGRDAQQLVEWQRQLNSIGVFNADLQRVQRYQRDIETIQSLRTDLDVKEQLDLHVEKARAFQKEIAHAEELRKEVDRRTRFADDLKRHVFSRIRDQNYRASLRLEGLDPSVDPEPASLEAIKAKYAG